MSKEKSPIYRGLQEAIDRFEESFDESLIRSRMADRWSDLELLGRGRCFEARALGPLVIKRVIDVEENPTYWDWWTKTLTGLRDLCGALAGWPPYRILMDGDVPVLVMPRLRVGAELQEPAGGTSMQKRLTESLAARGVAVRDHWQWGRDGDLVFLMDLSDLEPAP